MSKLFENKYYQQLFGESEEDHMERQKQQKKRQQQGGDETSERSESSEATENTRDRLERIFGGKGVKGMMKGQHLMAKPKVSGVRKTDAQILSEGKVDYAGRDGEGRQQFSFSNGAIAVRDDNGRFIIRQGASSAYMADLKSRPRKAKALVSNARAGKAFAAYWNRKMREAKSFDRKMGYKGKDSRAAAVKRSRTYHMKYSHADTSRHLDSSSPKGHLYLRKERVLRHKDGSVSMGTNGKPRVRRSGVAIYDFIGVAPKAVNPRKGSVDASRIRAAQAALPASRAAYSRLSASHSSRARSASATEAIAARNAHIAALREARGVSQFHAAPHPGSKVNRRPMSPEAKAAAAAKRRATLAAKPKAEKGSRKPRKDTGKKRGPMSAETKAKIAATKAAKKASK